jgi:hypothetical protein
MAFPSSSLLRCALVLAALALAAPRAVFAGVPDPAHCTVDHVLIGSYDTRGASAGPGPCAGGTAGFDVFVRDINGLPVAGAAVTVQFAGTGTGIRPFLTQNPPTTIDCTQRTLTVIADANGHAVLIPRFGHFALSPVIPVYANGQLLQYVEARSPDYDGDGQISLSDFNIFAADYNNLTPQPESDFDDCPTTRLGDFTFFVEQYLWDQGKPIEQRCN